MIRRDKIACSCRNITYGQIIDTVKSGAATYEEVKDLTGCGGRCGRCEDFIVAMIRDIRLFPADYE